MKEFFLYFIFLAFFSVCPVYASAQIGNPFDDEMILAFIEAIINVLMYLGILVSVFLIVYTGFLFVNARGNPEGITKAKTWAIWALIAAIVSVGLWTFAQVIGGTAEQIGPPYFP